MQRVVLILICLSLTACSNYSVLRKPGWLQNPFSKSGSDIKTATATRTVVDRGKNKTWYCYTDADQKQWDCQEQPAPDRIGATLSDKKTLPPLVRQASLSAAVTSSTPPPPVPELIPKPAPEKPVKPDIPETKTVPGALDRNTQFIMNHPVNHYAVQLIALESLAEVVAYAAEQYIEDPLYARVLTRDKIWVVLLLGIYADKNAASDAIDQWATTHDLKETPWIRRLDALFVAMKGASSDG